MQLQAAQPTKGITLVSRRHQPGGSVIGPVGSIPVAELAPAGSIADDTSCGPMNTHPPPADQAQPRAIAPGAASRAAAEIAKHRFTAVVGSLLRISGPESTGLARETKESGERYRARLHRASPS